MEHPYTSDATIDAAIEQIYTYDLLQNKVDAYRVLFELIEKMIRTQDWTALNWFLSKIEIEMLSNQMIVGVLRCSSRANKHLPNWYWCREAATTEFILRGVDYKHVLRGLYDI